MLGQTQCRTFCGHPAKILRAHLSVAPHLWTPGVAALLTESVSTSELGTRRVGLSCGDTHVWLCPVFAGFVPAPSAPIDAPRWGWVFTHHLLKGIWLAAEVPRCEHSCCKHPRAQKSSTPLGKRQGTRLLG